MIKRNLSTIILILILLLGLGIMFYPSMSSWWNSRVQSQAIVDYDAVVSSMSEEDYTAEFEKADAYNDSLKSLSFPLTDFEKVQGYEDALNVTGTGIIGYINIPRISEELPIYHGTSDAVLNSAAGHLEGTSLPVGGEGTHCVLLAHRGLPSNRLFTNLDKMEKGDRFTITVLNRVLTYEVDQIKVVEPTDYRDLFLEDGQDYVTLLTCTPYGINTQRLLVRGHRVPNAEEEDNLLTDDERESNLALLILIAAVLLLIILLTVLLNKRRNRKRDRRKSGRE